MNQTAHEQTHIPVLARAADRLARVLHEGGRAGWPRKRLLATLTQRTRGHPGLLSEVRSRMATSVARARRRPAHLRRRASSELRDAPATSRRALPQGSVEVPGVHSARQGLCHGRRCWRG